LSVLAAVLALATIFGSAPALAAEVTGKLLLATYRLPPKESAAGAFQWEIENGVKEVAPDRVDAKRELTVVLVGEGESAFPERMEVAFSGGGLLPSTIVARPGATLLFLNHDEIAHELYAVGDKSIAAEATSPRGRRSVTVKDAGVIELRDQLLPHLSGFIHVIPNAIAVATPNASGEYAFPEIKPGKYTVKVLHGKNEIASQEVEVGAKALAIDPIALTAPSGK
jgi:plastocyanin